MPTLLDRKDRMSMAWGLEVRVPFSDHRLVEYVWNIPWALKYTGGVVKGILRKALEDLLPPDILYRAKSPYPKTHHPLYHQTVMTMLEDILNDRNAFLHQLFDTNLLREHLGNGFRRVFGQPWFGQLMGDSQYLAYLVQLEAWMRHYRIRLF